MAFYGLLWICTSPLSEEKSVPAASRRDSIPLPPALTPLLPTPDSALSADLRLLAGAPSFATSHRATLDSLEVGQSAQLHTLLKGHLQHNVNVYVNSHKASVASGMLVPAVVLPNCFEGQGELAPQFSRALRHQTGGGVDNVGGMKTPLCLKPMGSG